MNRDSWQRVWVAVVVVVGSAVADARAAVLYAVTDLGPFDWPGVNVTGINASGQVVGSLALPSTSVVRGFRSSPGCPISAATDELGAFDTLPAPSNAYAINASGQVVGWADRGGRHYAFRTASNQTINPQTDDLGAGEGSTAYGINDSGQVVGGYGVGHAFRTGPNATFNAATDDLGNLGGGSATAQGINKSGQVVGVSTVSASVQHAFRTAPGAVIDRNADDLGTLGGTSSSARAVNDSGQVVGDSQVASGETHAFRTAANAAIDPITDDLGTLGGPLSLARAINGQGDVVGYSKVADQSIHAFLYSGTAMQDLNELIEPASGWMLLDAAGINHTGQIVGRGSHNGQGRIFLLTPVPEPSTLVWTGALDGIWDVNTTTNFSGGSSGKFNDGDRVTFDNTGSNTTIAIASSGVAPGSVTFSNTTAKTYSLSGGPIKGTTSLTVSGGGHVTLSSANTYTGGTLVSQGTLTIASAAALPPGRSLTIGAGGMVVLSSGLGGAGQASTPAAPAAAVPEPSTVGLLLAAVFSVLAYAWRRRRLVAVP